MSANQLIVNRNNLAEAVEAVSARDPRLAALYEQFGLPPLWRRPQTFSTLVHIVLEQKVSLVSALAVMRRVQALCPGMSAGDFLTLERSALREAGVSERKIDSCRVLARSLEAGTLSLVRLRHLDNEAVVESLSALHGIGPWTAGVYLLMAMRRADAWASGDRALVVSARDSFALDRIPSYDEFDQMAELWRPYRAVAARLLWHAYLERRAEVTSRPPPSGI